MVKPELGTKRACQQCGARFYDLNRDPIVCPKCGHEHTLDMFNRSRRGRLAPAEAPRGRPVKAVPAPGADEDEVEEVEVEVEETEEDSELIEDASELGEDEEDMAEVIENVDEDDVDVEER